MYILFSTYHTHCVKVVQLLFSVENVGQLTFHQDEKSGGHNVSSVSRLQLRRREARIRQQACQLYQSQVLEDVFLRLEVEVESRRLTMRPDRTIHSDIGLRERLIEVLNSYSIVWLRLGVEVWHHNTIVAYVLIHTSYVYVCMNKRQFRGHMKTLDYYGLCSVLFIYYSPPSLKCTHCSTGVAWGDPSLTLH